MFDRRPASMKQPNKLKILCSVTAGVTYDVRPAFDSLGGDMLREVRGVHSLFCRIQGG